MIHLYDYYSTGCAVLGTDHSSHIKLYGRRVKYRHVRHFEPTRVPDIATITIMGTAAYLKQQYRLLDSTADDQEWRFKRAFENFVAHLESLVPELEPDATKEECQEAAVVFSRYFYAVVNKNSECRKQLKASKARVQLKLDRFDKTFASDLRSLSSSERRYVREYRESVDQQRRRKESFFSKSIGNRDYELFQFFVHKMLEGQGEEAVSFVLGEHNPFSAHLNTEYNFRPAVELEPKVPFSGALQIPVEVAAMVYSYCSLESCLALRHVTSQWYHAFHDCEGIFEQKLNERCPWIYPEGDLKSWADCVLVFLARLLNPVWTREKSISGLKVPKPDGRSPSRLVARELKQTLPVGFEPLQCGDILHTSFETVSRTDTETVVECEGLTEQVTFPAGTRVNTMCVYRDKVIAYCLFYNWEFDRTQPLHYNFARCNKPRGKDCQYQERFSIGPWAVIKRGLRHHKVFEFCSPHSNRSVQYGPVGDYDAMKPFAVYQGLVKWSGCHSQKHLVPTFVDLQDPEVVYCKTARIIEVLEPRYSGTDFQQYGNLVYTKPTSWNLNEPLQVVDLDTGSVTSIEPPNEPLGKQWSPKDHPTSFLLGFGQGTFHALYWDRPKVLDDEMYESIHRYNGEGRYQGH